MHTYLMTFQTRVFRKRNLKRTNVILSFSDLFLQAESLSDCITTLRYKFSQSPKEIIEQFNFHWFLNDLQDDGWQWNW